MVVLHNAARFSCLTFLLLNTFILGYSIEFYGEDHLFISSWFLNSPLIELAPHDLFCNQQFSVTAIRNQEICSNPMADTSACALTQPRVQLSLISSGNIETRCSRHLVSMPVCWESHRDGSGAFSSRQNTKTRCIASSQKEFLRMT